MRALVGILLFFAPVHLNARSSPFSLQEVLRSAYQHLSRYNGSSDYYLIAVRSTSEPVTSVATPAEKSKRSYEVWWVKPGIQRDHYVGVGVSEAGKTWALRPSASQRRDKWIGGAPAISLARALELAEAFDRQHGLSSPQHYVFSASLVLRDRSADEMYWQIWLRFPNDEAGDVQLLVRMDGSVDRLGLI